MLNANVLLKCSISVFTGLKGLSIVSGLRSLCLSVILFLPFVSVSAQSIDELPAQIVAIDIAAKKVTLAALGMQASDFTLAFDVKIKLFNGDLGTVGNLRVGDGVTAVIDRSGSLVKALYVVSQNENVVFEQ